MLDSVHPPTNQIPQKRRGYIWLAVIFLILAGLGVLAGSRLSSFAEKILEGEGNKFSFREFFVADDKKLKGEEEGQIRILLMGIGGEKHDGGTLTDTMILATLDLREKNNPRVGLVSVPRDLVVYIPGYEYRKINNAHAFGGSSLAVETMEKFIGKDIPYYGVIDFDGFKKVIDDLDGVEINVERAFTDKFFPDEKGGYLAPIEFQTGRQEMDEERALQFVRSRHGDNNEGTDFARARRQQQVLRAVKEEVTSFRILSNIGLINKILEDLSDHVRTNIAPHELMRIYDLGKSIKNENIHSLTLDTDTGLVCNQILEENGAYVLVPCKGLAEYGAIRDLISNQFTLSRLQRERSSIEIQNSTSIEGLGNRVQNLIGAPTLQITVGNFKGEVSYAESIIYDNSKGEKKETLSYLKDKLGARVAGSPFPFSVASTSSPDFVIVVASDLETKTR